MRRDQIQAFDPQQPYSVIWRRKLPHWVQAGTMCFITWRTDDSLPRDVLERWIRERNALLLRAGISVNAAGFGEGGRHWKDLLAQIVPDARWSVQCALTERFEAHLDTCHGACLLRQPELAAIVAECLRKFDGQRYELTDFVVMPNHVHLLAAFPDEKALLAQCASWKRYTARKINVLTGRKGEFWQDDSFDHLVRSAGQFEHYRRYIAANGSKAKLPATNYLCFSKL